MRHWPCRPNATARIARDTQIFLQQETDTCDTVDPWGGSHYVEWLTDQLVQQGTGAH